MAHYISRLSKEKFSEYLKLGLALKITKEGLQGIVKKETNDFHCIILQELIGKQLCSECRIENLLECPSTGLCSLKHCSFHSLSLRQLRRCPNGSCNIIRDKIRENFRYNKSSIPEPSWSNTNAQLWTTNAFQVMKCYLPRSKYQGIGKIEDVDLNGLINVIINNKRFDKILSDDLIEKDNSYIKVLEIEKYYRNCDSLTISDWQFTEHLKEMIKLLKGTSVLMHNQGAQQAVTKLEQIKSDTLIVNTQTLTEVLSELILSITKDDEEKARRRGKHKKRSIQKSTTIPKLRLNLLSGCHDIFSRDHRNIKLCQLESIISKLRGTIHELQESVKKTKMSENKEMDSGATQRKRIKYEANDTTMQSLFPEKSYDELKTDQVKTDWEQCLCKDTEFSKKIAERLIKSRYFPEQQALNEICKKFGREEKLIKTICTELAASIKNKSEKIVQVIPSYYKESDQSEKIIFVICTKAALSRAEMGTVKQYSHKIRPIGEYSLEGQEVLQNKLFMEQNLKLKELENLKKCINKHADMLLSKHRQLSIIAPSALRSKFYGTSKATIIREPCIVLFVHTKNYIPIDEEPFDDHYEGIPIDVREGGFMTHPRIPSGGEISDGLKMGCNIGSVACEKFGTLGGFIEHPKYGLCGLTCAHVLLSNEWMGDLKQHGSMKWPTFHPVEGVTHPGGTANVVGRLVEAVYTKGQSEQSGMEIALFQIEEHRPSSGKFHGNDDMAFDSGKSHDVSVLNDVPVVKLGSTTHKTTGQFIMKEPATTVRTLTYRANVGNHEITLHNQLEVMPHKWFSKGNRFSKPGDSGSLVFMERSDEYICVGMVEGGTSYGTSIVTPILPILQACGVNSLKSFETANLYKHLSNLTSTVTKMKSDMDQHFPLIMQMYEEMKRRKDNQ
ncbi:uncharacterized protein LOC132754833 [Ruditapes philippinarum]|uniref:uncharacterized protein LOC132754833 n=1 Tax=Ruditapes philippinarum TaxID=129788 RepID=UPI00295A7E67|nr:uncharacterized protein LOC132754833 [Ruditapes philippinarum]